MARTRRIPLIALAILATLVVGGPAAAKKPTPETVAGELLIGFRAGVTEAEQRSVLRAVGASEQKEFKRIHGSLVRVSPDALSAALDRLRKDPRVRYAEPNFVVHADVVPNDASFSALWGMSRIAAPAAWDVTTGSAAVTVADIDTGVDWSHPDLSARIWVNAGESCISCRTDGVDNDGNGYVDDWRGWDFANDDNDPMDDHGHGTHVAGTIGAAGNNGVGVVGVNWDVRIMPVKFLNAQGSGTTADAVGAVLYAAQNGADVMNNSWAGGDYSQALADAITVADQRNSLFVAAAGNEGSDNDAQPTYPASYDLPNVVSVAATGSSDDPAYFSNYGRESVDLGAPGVNVYSTWPGGGYQYLSGTSMATPHVAGAAALAKAAFPAASAVGLKALLLDSADPAAGLDGITASGGRLNVGNAVACNATPHVWIDSVASGFVVDVGTPVAFSAIATNCADSGGVTVTASMNGTPVALTPRGDGFYTGAFTPTTRGAVTFSVTAATEDASRTRSVTGSATEAYPISAGGPPVTVTTTSVGENAELRFSATAGQRISLALSGVTMSAAQVWISKPGGGTVATTYVGTSGGFIDAKTLAVDGVYRIVVDPVLDATGSMTLTLYDVPADALGTIVPGGPAASIATTVPGQNARMTFPGAAGQRVSLQFSRVSFPLAFVSILKPDGTALASNKYVGSGSTFIDVMTLPSGGTYAITINPQDSAIGSATLTLYDVPEDAGGTITPGGASVSIATSVPGQNGRLTFNGSAGQRVSVKMTSITFSSATASIVGPDGKNVGSSSVFGAPSGFMDVRTLPATGAYSIFVNPPDKTTGSATFTLYDVPADASGTLMPGGASTPVSMTVPGQNAKYTFEGAAGQRVSLKIGPTTLSQAYVSIANPDGSSLVKSTIFASPGTFIDTKTLPVAGTYTITINPQDSATGSATLTLYDVPADVSGNLAIGGEPQTISVSVPGQNARITFDGTAGRAISLKVSGITISSSYVSILKPDGTTLVANTLFSTVGSTITKTLPVDGSYTIVVNPQGAATGSMTLTLL